MKTLLVPFDYSDMSHSAAEQATELAAALKARVLLCYIHHLEHVRPEHQTGEVTYEEMESERRRLNAAVRRLKERHPDVTIETSVQIGTPFEGILAEAEREGASMIVMGTHGRTGLSHLVLGSVAERVVQKATIPVLVTKRGVAAAREAA